MFTSFISHNHDRGGRSESLRVPHFKTNQILGEHAEVLDGVLADLRPLDVHQGVVDLVQVSLPVAQPVAQELTVQGGWVGWFPSQVDAVTARVMS